MGPGVNSLCTIDLLIWFPYKMFMTWTIAAEYKYKLQSRINIEILSLKEPECSLESEREAG